MTAEQAAKAEPAAADHAPLADGLDAVLAAARTEFAVADQERREHGLIAAQETFDPEARGAPDGGQELMPVNGR